MFLYPVNLSVNLLRPVPVSTFMVPRILLSTGAVLGDGPPCFALVFTTVYETHVEKHITLHRFHPSPNLVYFLVILSHSRPVTRE